MSQHCACCRRAGDKHFASRRGPPGRLSLASPSYHHITSRDMIGRLCLNIPKNSSQFTNVLKTHAIFVCRGWESRWSKVQEVGAFKGALEGSEKEGAEQHTVRCGLHGTEQVAAQIRTVNILGWCWFFKKLGENCVWPITDWSSACRL